VAVVVAVYVYREKETPKKEGAVKHYIQSPLMLIKPNAQKIGRRRKKKGNMKGSSLLKCVHSGFIDPGFNRIMPLKKEH
jgi:hypothetical protein